MTSSNGMIHSDFLKNWMEKEVRSDLELYGNKHIEQTGKWNVLTALQSSVTMTCSPHLLGNE